MWWKIQSTFCKIIKWRRGGQISAIIFEQKQQGETFFCFWLKVTIYQFSNLRLLKVQIFWEGHKNLAHLPLFIWHYIPYARHYKPRLVFILTHFSLRLIFQSGQYCRAAYVSWFFFIHLTYPTFLLQRKKKER